jgi:hypothetical protein
LSDPDPQQVPPNRSGYLVRFLFAGLALVVVLVFVVQPWKALSNSGGVTQVPQLTSPALITDTGDNRARLFSTTVIPDLRIALETIGEVPQPDVASERVITTISGSLPEDFAALESLMRTLGGDYAASDETFNNSRRWWRSVPKANRPEFAAEMSDSEWEQWVNRASKGDLLSLPDDTRAPVREIDLANLAAEKFDTLDQASVASIDATIREIAKERGFSDPERANIVGFQGRLRYRPPDEGEPQPSPIVVVYVSGLTTDDRDFVAAYIFGFREPTGWFPYFVRSLSQHRETTPPMRRIPFVPAF